MAQTKLSLEGSSRPLGRPYKKGSWLIFPNTFPVGGQDLPNMNCESNIDGVCTYADSVEDCIKQCADSPRRACHYGYFISKPAKICMPRMGASFYPHRDPVFSWAPKDANNPALDGIEMTAFLDSSGLRVTDPYNLEDRVFPNPYNNSIYFGDDVYLKNIETGTRLFTPYDLISASTSEIPFIQFQKEAASPLSVTFSNPYNKEVTLLSDLSYYGSFVLTLGDTDFIFRDFGEYVGWILRGNIEIFPGQRLSLIPVEKNKRHVHAAYGAPFYIRYGDGGVLGLDGENRLRIYKDVVSNLHESKNAITFAFESLMSVYTCEGERCVEIPQRDLEPGTAISNFKGRDAFRSPTCFGLCGYDLKNLPAWSPEVEKELLGDGTVKIRLVVLAALLAIYFISLWIFTPRLRTKAR